MIRLVALITVLGFFWSPALASFQIYSIPSSDGEYTEQTVSIDNENQVANIHVYGGLCSSDTIFDYKHGYIATRIFSRRACFILKMEPDYIMQLEDVGRLAYEKQVLEEEWLNLPLELGRSKGGGLVSVVLRTEPPNTFLDGQEVKEVILRMMQQMVSPQNVWVQYEPSDSFFGEIKEWLTYGSSIEKLCKNVPVYRVERIDRGVHGGACVKAGILGILGISICGKVNL